MPAARVVCLALVALTTLASCGAEPRATRDATAASPGSAQLRDPRAAGGERRRLEARHQAWQRGGSDQRAGSGPHAETGSTAEAGSQATQADLQNQPPRTRARAATHDDAEAQAGRRRRLDGSEASALSTATMRSLRIGRSMGAAMIQAEAKRRNDIWRETFDSFRHLEVGLHELSEKVTLKHEL